MLFSQYTFNPYDVPEKKNEPRWLSEARKRDSSLTTSPHEQGLILIGDPHDGVSIFPKLMRWGLPNVWMSNKGLSPFDGAICFVSTKQAFGEGDSIGSRGLVPLTTLVATTCPHYTPQLRTAAVLYQAPAEAPGEYGFCFLADGDSILLIDQAEHARWLSGWSSKPELALIGRMWAPNIA